MQHKNLTEKEWKEKLTPEQYQLLRERGTERAFTGEYNKNKKTGSYQCAGCGTTLFHSNAKFDSGSGWPSFFEPINNTRVKTETDRSHGMARIEILCGNCNGHLGHVFDDGPQPTGQRYCVNSGSLKFNEEV